MSKTKPIKKVSIDTKRLLHNRNLHNSRYDFVKLSEVFPLLQEYVLLNKYNDLTIDFSNAKAVLTLNRALLFYFYNIKNWDLPIDSLCPPIPGRADYIHYVADLLASCNKNVIPKSKKVKVLDIGVGANNIYPIIGSVIYDWNFKASDIDEESLKNVDKIISENENLNGKIKTIKQPNNDDIFVNIINNNEYFDLTLCNPPFHKSKKDAQEGSLRKVKNLSKDKNKKLNLNFAGKSNELWCKGGEVAFIKKMIIQSKIYKNNCLWFTTLVSKKENLDLILKYLNEIGIKESKIINMSQGQKISRIVAWTFLDKKEQKAWYNHD